jgi:hypothetical protein
MWNMKPIRFPTEFCQRVLHVMGAVIVVLIVTGAGRVSVSATVLTFDDLYAVVDLTGNGYGGLTWEQGNAGTQGNIGFWLTGSGAHGSYPHSQPINVVNAAGCSLIGIGFPTAVNMQGAYIAGQGDFFTTGVRVHGFLGGQETNYTGWFTTITAAPRWMDMSVLTDVDRIVFEAIPVFQGGGAFGMDDLTFTVHSPEPGSLAFLTFGGMCLLGRRRS